MKVSNGIVEFVKVVEEGSFSAAARTLGVSKAYISQRVSQLEARLGAKLLHRTTRKLTLTEAGGIYYKSVGDIFARMLEGEERVKDFQESPRGQIKVSMVDGGLGEWYLAPVLARFAAQNPGVEINLDLSSRLVNLEAEGFDFAVRVGPLADSDLIAVKLTSFRYGIYVSPAYLEKHGTISNPEQLQSHNCLTGAAKRWEFKKGQRSFSMTPRGTWHSKSGQTLIHAATQAVGIVRTASFYADDAQEKGALVEILADWCQQKTSVWIVYPGRQQLPLRVRRAISFFRDEFRVGKDLFK